MLHQYNVTYIVYPNFTFSKFLKKQKSILTLEFFSNRSKTAGFSLKMNSIRCCGSDFLRQIFLAIFSFNENQRNIFSFSDFWISDFQNSAQVDIQNFWISDFQNSAQVDIQNFFFFKKFSGIFEGGLNHVFQKVGRSRVDIVQDF